MPRLLLFCLALSACSSSSPKELQSEEVKLETTGELARYHVLLTDPYGTALQHPGFILGIEKSPFEKIAYPNSREINPNRTARWTPTDDPAANRMLKHRNRHQDRVLNDGKKVFVSHVYEYSADGKNGGVLPSPLFSAYAYSSFPKGSPPPKCATDPTAGQHYENSWRALECLQASLEDKLKDAKASGKPYSHVIVSSMGWNNDQIESVRRYNIMTGRLKALAAQDPTMLDFNPLVLGITWPSVWSTSGGLDLANKVLHIGSYANKADDADEIGFTIANELINRVVPQATKNYDVKTVLVGHSMGARILSRALYSDHLMVPKIDPYTNKDTLMIGLQGAFSVRRFKEGPHVPALLRLAFTDEGAPYLDWNAPRAKMILTWSKEDKANPVARLLTGAAHVGGKVGYEKSQDNKEVFREVTWSGDQNPDACETLRQPGIGYVDASSIIEDHGDILNPAVARFMMDMLKCFP